MSTLNQSSSEIANRIKELGIIAIIRGSFTVQEMMGIGDALLAAPVLTMEVTLNTPSALDAIRDLRARYGKNMVVGAGTVRTVEQFDAALKAGAQFTVAPNLDLPTVARAQERDILHLPGVFTATEVQIAYAAGCKTVKLFPSDVVGPSYMKALSAPLSDVEFVPTGGIDINNIGQYAAAGAVAVGLGSSLVPKAWSQAEIITNCRALRAKWDAGKVG